MSSGEDVLIESLGRKFAGLAWGPEKGRRVLALHGWLDNAASFERLAPLLEDCRVIAVDMAGHGLSEWRARGATYHFVDYVMDVLDVTTELGWDDPFVLVGHSMGAGIASLVAGAAADRVAALICLDGLGPATFPPEGAINNLVAYVTQRVRLGRKQKTAYSTWDDMAQKLVQVTKNLSLESARILVKRGAVQFDGKWTWSADPRLRHKSPHPFTEEHVHTLLRRITCPSLVLWANEGWPFPQEGMQKRVDCLQHADVSHADGGHHFHMENPEAVAQEIQKFLAKQL